MEAHNNCEECEISDSLMINCIEITKKKIKSKNNDNKTV